VRKLLRIDMGNLTSEFSEVPDEYKRLGGRGLTSTLISREAAPLCHPLGPNNKLVIAPGILTGTKSPCTARISVGAKSPLTGGIKESNCGGVVGQKMARLGLTAIVLQGMPRDKRLHLLHLTKEGIRFHDAEDMRGWGNYRVAAHLQDKFGTQVGVISLGPAGEMLLSAATVAMTDKDGRPARHAARGGIGAVMGARGVKAIVIDDAGAPKVLPAVNQTSFNAAAKSFAKTIHQRPRRKGLTAYGTARLIAFANEVNSLPTRNFSTGQFEGVERISGEALAERIDGRGGERGHACYPGCVVRCSNVYRDKERKYLTSALEYETIGMFGSNCGIDDLDVIATLDRLCDDYGLDTIEMGGAIGVAMDGGVLPFGDGARAVELLHEAGKGTPLGRILASGVAVTGKVFGLWRVPAIKNQGMPAWDPRTAMGTGLTIMTSPQGADHNAGRIPGIKEFDFFRPGSIAPLSLGMQLRVCVMDTVGLCMFADGTPESSEWLSKMLSAFYGEEIGVQDLLRLGKEIFDTERDFNLAAGITRAEDRLPEFMRIEPLPPTNSAFTVTEKEINEVFYSPTQQALEAVKGDEYYKIFRKKSEDHRF